MTRLTKLTKMMLAISEEFKDKLAAAMMARFGVEVETYFNIILVELITRRVDGQDFTPEQMQFLTGYSEGYCQVLNRVKEEASR